MRERGQKKENFKAYINRKFRKMRKNGEAGWSLIETLLVIGIVIILSSVIGFQAVGAINKANIVNAKSTIQALNLGLTSYMMDTGVFPSEEQGLKALWERPIIDEPKYWGGPYVNKQITDDPWGNPYVYKRPGPREGLLYDIISYGADGQEGGEDVDADISVWGE